MEKLIRGIIDFRKNVLPDRRDTFAQLATGQTPDVLFITCSDSRVAPNWFASTNPGELFVVRNIGNLVPRYDAKNIAEMDSSVAAAIDFALDNLQVKDIVVCGHSGCGAIHAVAEGLENVRSSHLQHWLVHTKPTRRHSALHEDDSLQLSSEDKLSQKNVLQQIDNLKTYPTIKQKFKNREIRLHAWWFNIAEGGVYGFDETEGRFILIDEKVARGLLAEEVDTGEITS